MTLADKISPKFENNLINSFESKSRGKFLIKIFPAPEFLKDLLDEVGTDKTFEFVRNTFSELGAMSSPGLKIDLSNTVGETGSYMYLIINGVNLAHREDDTLEVWVNYSFGKHQLIHDGEIKTLDDIYEDVGLGEMGEWDDLFNSIKEECIDYLFLTTGFITHFDYQT
jgi:hypothetical protein